ncbi:MAG: leucine-rich repeat domain-containing protein [Clostridia bacterium]|nr:leucine-rich repeat domain-containing protein [Clostridia bacterium]
MKRIISAFLALVLAALCLAAVGCTPADNPDVPGTSNVPATTAPIEQPDPDVPGYNYVLNGGTATITGYTGEDKDLVIPKYAGGVPVTAIADTAFTNNHVIESVTIPGTVTNTGMMSFFGCTALKKVVLGEGITSVARGSFNECKALEEIVFPSTLSFIDDVAFQGAASLTSVSFPEALHRVGYRAFANSGLVDVVLPANCTIIDGGVFAGCASLKSCVFLGSFTGLSQDMFRECQALESVKLPAEVSTLGEYAFYRCTSLKELDAGMTNYFCNYSLWGCTSLEAVYLHTTKMDRICNRVFAFVPNLKNIYYAGTMESWTGMRRIDDWNESLPGITINADWQG